MTRSDPPDRRTVLSTVAAVAIGTTALAVRSRTETTDDPDPPVDPGTPTTERTTTESGRPVVDNGADDPGRNVVVDVRVVDGGDPVAAEPVVLQDRGGTPDDRYGTTGSRGWIRFVENVGPPPCNRQTVILPDRDRQVPLGCNDGPTTLERVIEVGADRGTVGD